MPSVLDVPKEFLRALRDTLVALLQILVIFKRHPVFTLVLVFVAICYGSGWWLTYAIPEQRIQTFFLQLQNKADIEDTWNMLDRNYQKTWGNDPNRFESGYKTTVAYEDMRISPEGHALNPFGFLFFNSLTYNVSFIVEDRLSKDDLADPLQKRVNCKWLSIAHPIDYPRLEQGTLGYDTLSMKRYYRQTFVMKRSTWKDWLIANIQTQE